MAADMLLLVESAKAAVEYAGWAVDNDSEDADLSVSIAKSYASEAAIQVTGDAIQMHGGIGFTWENDMHLFFKRARRSASVLGDVYAHREKIARYTLDPIKVEVLA
jgi:alkylation response protein AidB-like acyl-CoA dehydrogenase